MLGERFIHKGIMPGYHLILPDINTKSPSGLEGVSGNSRITFHVAALRLKYANIRVNQL